MVGPCQPRGAFAVRINSYIVEIPRGQSSKVENLSDHVKQVSAFTLYVHLQMYANSEQLVEFLRRGDILSK